MTETIIYALAAVAFFILVKHVIKVMLKIHRDVMDQMRLHERQRRIGEYLMQNEQQQRAAIWHSFMQQQNKVDPDVDVKGALTVSENCWRVRQIIRKHKSLVNATRLWNWADHQDHSECYWKVIAQEYPEAFVDVRDLNTIKWRYAK